MTKIMIKNIWKAALLCIAFASCDNNVDKLLCYGNHDQIENDITLAGAVGDGKTDCSEVINKMISELPDNGGTIVIPEGDFVLDSPIVLSKSNVVIKGLNSGFRSNIDVKDTTLVGPGGGSKLIVRNAESAITLGAEGLSGLEIRDLMISGGTENNGVGVLFQKATTGTKIDNVVGINLLTGVEIHEATGLTISNCWICELSNSIVLKGGQNNTVKNCQLGAQPTGVTCSFTDEAGMLFQRNQVYPDGKTNLLMRNCDDAQITSNNFASYYTAIIDIEGNNNLIKDNMIALTGAVAHQCAYKSSDYGVVRIAGDGNRFSTNSLKCEWAAENGVTIRATEGMDNVFENCLISDVSSENVFLVNQYAVVTNCVSNDKIKNEIFQPEVDEFTESVALLLLADTEEGITDDDELAARDWFKKTCTNGTVLTLGTLATADLSAYKVIWVALDRVWLGWGPDRLPITADAIEILNNYYKNGGNLYLTNHATQLIAVMGRTERYPGIFGDGEGGSGNDSWSLQANIGMTYDRRNHPLYAGMVEFGDYGHPTFPLIGPGHREDHNCKWDFNAYGYRELYPEAENNVVAFEMENQAVVLGAWGHVTDFACFGVIEFEATDEYKGTCIANGMAAYEWNQNSGPNVHQYNIKLMTRNALDYLSKK